MPVASESTVVFSSGFCHFHRLLHQLRVQSRNKFGYFPFIFHGVLILMEIGVCVVCDLSPGVGTCDNGLWEGNVKRDGGFGGREEVFLGWEGGLPPSSAVPQRYRCGDSLVSSPPPPIAGLRHSDMMGPFSWAHHSVGVCVCVRGADPS